MAVFSRSRRVSHPVVIRLTHWVNVAAMAGMITSGMGIYNAHPVVPALVFPPSITLGGWLGAATIWHFAVMWLLVGNGLVYLAYGLASGYLRRRLLPLRVGDVLRDLRAALTGRLGHEAGRYNAVQKLFYLAVLLCGALMVTSGLAIWKPVQLAPLTALFGGFDTARIVHFLGMAAILGFVIVHLFMVLLVPRSLWSMVAGTATAAEKDSQS